MKNRLSLGYSTCPNDTYIFHALAHNHIDTGDLKFDIRLADVEQLNQWAQRDLLDISKLSIAAVGHLGGRYRLLSSGAALGNGCGPLIIARPGTGLSKIADAAIAVPGMFTTAHMLLGLYMKKPPIATPMVFDEIMPAVGDGRYDYGVIIHEGRFTYENYGLNCLLDLGQWWEQTTGMPIPLGGIAVRNDLEPQTAKQVETAVRDSILYARIHPEAAHEYIRGHAREMADDVIRQHIGLYVNDYSLDLGDTGRKAIETLLDLARKHRLIGGSTHPRFIVSN